MIAPTLETPETTEPEPTTPGVEVGTTEGGDVQVEQPVEQPATQPEPGGDDQGGDED